MKVSADEFAPFTATGDALVLASVSSAAEQELLDSRVNLVSDRRGRLVKRDTEGTIPGVLTFQGQSYTLPLGSAPELPPELGALISIQTGVTDQSDARGLKVTALRITLLSGTAAGTVVNLGNAKASIRES